MQFECSLSASGYEDYAEYQNHSFKPRFKSSGSDGTGFFNDRYSEKSSIHGLFKIKDEHF